LGTGQERACEASDVLDGPVVGQCKHKPCSVQFTLITLGNNPVKGDLLDQDGDGLETPSIDQPAESMFNTFEVIFAGESLQIRSCD
jgi:hypothetical protein